jgi:hypothetical protein
MDERPLSMRHVRPTGRMEFKDEVLDRISETANIAQFVSFDPRLNQRYARIRGCAPNQRFDSIESALTALFVASTNGLVNIRSFRPGGLQRSKFVTRLKSVAQAANWLAILSSKGLYTIANESIEMGADAVGGVALNNIIEFAPGETPRCVEGPATAYLARSSGLKLLSIVFGFDVRLDYPPELRVEFTVHPLRHGFRGEHVIVWELDEMDQIEYPTRPSWPNKFSRAIGDKCFGLLVAWLSGLPVPKTHAVTRTFPPFSFGEATGTGETWLRTSPAEQLPGAFPTTRGWQDPFRLMEGLRRQRNSVVSILAQEGVDAAFAGAVVTARDGTPIIEGVRGYGQQFMLGETGPEKLPPEVLRAVSRLFYSAAEIFGTARLEWAFEAASARAWILQLHREMSGSQGVVIVPGTVSRYKRFSVKKSIASLRRLVEATRGTDHGIVLVGRVGVTSHLADLLRKARIPSYIEPSTESSPKSTGRKKAKRLASKRTK